MGVTHLWQILSPVQEHQSLASLEGLILAVDLSIWICESDGVKHMQGVVCKPYLRNLFFRILHLTQIGVKLVFVIDGTPPELKWEVMAKRQQARFPGRQGKQTIQQKPPTKQSRKNFNAILRECCELLDMLGIPYVQSKGEAEAMCALLNSSGLVDGCLTDDGDAFLYGAQTVFRNFTMNAKDPHVERYRYMDIESQLGIDRNGLIALALLLGCDFIPKGVSGVGMASALKLLDCLKGRNVLERLKDWRKIHESQCLDPVEKMVRVKALSASDFPQMDVINEFLQPKDRCASRLSSWKRPVPVKLQNFALLKLEWPVEYTFEKILPLVTLWDMQDALQSRNPSKHQHLKPHRIVKTRIRHGVPCYEIEWFKPVTDPYHEGDYYVTIETQELFSKCYPTIVQTYLGETNSKNKKKKAKKKKAKEKAQDKEEKAVENLSFNFGKLNIRKVTHKLQESLRDLHPSFTDYEGSVLTTKVKQSNLSQASNKPCISTNQCDISFNHENHKEVGQLPDDIDLPLSERIKLRLQKNKQNQNSVGKEPHMITDRPDDLFQTGCHSSGKRKKKKNRSDIKVSNSSPCAPLNSPGSHITFSSGKIRHRETRKMSSPAPNAFCSPASYIKQSLREDGDKAFKDSPIYQIHTDQNGRQQKTTSTNFKFFETPNRGSSPSVNLKSTSNPTRTGNNLKTDKTSTPSMLKDSWQTEYVENYFNELSKELSFSVNGNVQANNGGSTTLKHPKQNNYPPNSQQVPKSNSSNQSSLKIKPSMNDTHEINFGEFELQSSLLNSLCASLIQTLTPKGMNKEQYDSLCESLKKIDEGGRNLDEDVRNIVTDNIACNIDFSDIEEVSAKLGHVFTPKINLKPMTDASNRHFKADENQSTGLSKSARRRRKKKQMKAMDVSANNGTQSEVLREYQANTETLRLDSSTRLKMGNSAGNTVHYSIPNNGPSKRDEKQQTTNQTNIHGANEVYDCVNSGIISTANQNGQDMTSSKSDLSNKLNSIAQESKKRKKQKKKVKMASADIDLSVDIEDCNESLFKNCSEYLQKALKEKTTKKSQTGNIEKASPVIDLSDDDTFLELEVLSSCLSGNFASTNLDAKRKLALKKKLSKRKTGTDDVTTLSEAVSSEDKIDTDVEGHSLKDSSQTDPVLSINTAMSSLSIDPARAEKCEHTSHIEDDYAGNKAPWETLDASWHNKQCEDLADNEISMGFDFENNGGDMKVVGTSSITNKRAEERGHWTHANLYDEEKLAGFERNLMYAKPSSLSGWVNIEEKAAGDCCKKKSDSVIKDKDSMKRGCLRSKEMSSMRELSGNVYNPKHGQRQHCCRLDMGSSSSETEVYERNIQTCKDLRSWSQLPIKSAGNPCSTRRAESSVGLDFRLGLHNIHRHPKDQRRRYTDAEKWIKNYMRDVDKGIITTNCEVNYATSGTKALDQDSELKLDKFDISDFDGETEDNAEIDNDSLDGVEIERDALEKYTVDLGACDDTNKGSEQFGNEEIFVDEPEDSLGTEFGSELAIELTDQNKDDRGLAVEHNTSDIQLAQQPKHSIIRESDSESSKSASFTVSMGTSKPPSIDEEKGGTCFFISDIQFYSEDCEPKQNGVTKVPNIPEKAGCQVEYLEVSKNGGDFGFNNEPHTMSEGNFSNGDNTCSTHVLAENVSDFRSNGFCNGTEDKRAALNDFANTNPENDAEYDTEDTDISNRSAEICTEVGTCNGFISRTNGFCASDDLAENLLEHSRGNCPAGDIEGSSDKENEKVVELPGHMLSENLSNSNTSVNLVNEDSQDGCSYSSRPTEENASSPMPLLDRLKLKFKKSSARSVLHSFTNGR